MVVNQEVNIEDIRVLIKNAFDYINNKIQIAISFFQKEKKYDLYDIIDDLKQSYISLGDTLKKIPLYENEYYNYSSIKNMSFYILDDEILLKKYFTIIKEMIFSFHAVILLKMELNNEEYDIIYENFTSSLIGGEQLFYSEIYTPSKFSDYKTLSEINNGLFK